MYSAGIFKRFIRGMSPLQERETRKSIRLFLKAGKMHFDNLGIQPFVLRAIEEEKFQEPSEIQRKTIPLVIKRKDVIAGSATGSGKTFTMFGD